MSHQSVSTPSKRLHLIARSVALNSWLACNVAHLRKSDEITKLSVRGAAARLIIDGLRGAQAYQTLKQFANPVTKDTRVSRGYGGRLVIKFYKLGGTWGDQYQRLVPYLKLTFGAKVTHVCHFQAYSEDVGMWEAYLLTGSRIMKKSGMK